MNCNRETRGSSNNWLANKIYVSPCTTSKSNRSAAPREYIFPRRIIESNLRIRIMSTNYVEQEWLTHGKFRLTVGVNDWSIKFSSQLVCCRPANDLMTGIHHLRVPLFLPHPILLSFSFPVPLLSAVLFLSFTGNTVRVKQRGRQTSNNVRELVDA